MKSGHDSSLNDACHISPSPPEPGRCGPRRSSLEPFIFQLPFVRDIGAGPRTADCHPHRGGRASNKPSQRFHNYEEDRLQEFSHLRHYAKQVPKQ